MDAATLVCHRFRGTRQLVGHLAAAGAGLVLFVVLGVSVVVAPPSTGSTGEWGGLAVCTVGVLAVGALLVRMRTACTVELSDAALTYRTLLRTLRFDRTDVVGIGLRFRTKGTARLTEPFLDMRDGRTVRLADMAQGRLVAPASTMQAELVGAVDARMR